MESLRNRIANDLTKAMRDRDKTKVSVLRTALSALANAGAVETTHSSLPVAGLYAAEAERREITDEHALRLLREERDELLSSAEEYARHGRHDDAAELEAKAAILGAYIDDADTAAS